MDIEEPTSNDNTETSIELLGTVTPEDSLKIKYMNALQNGEVIDLTKDTQLLTTYSSNTTYPDTNTNQFNNQYTQQQMQQPQMQQPQMQQPQMQPNMIMPTDQFQRQELQEYYYNIQYNEVCNMFQIININS